MLKAIIRNACLLLLPVLTTPACTTTLFNSDSSAAQTPASEAVASPRSLPTESVPTAVVPTTRPTAKPTVGLTATPVPEFSVLEAEFGDLSAYRSAMLPQFRADIDQIAAAGATRYDLDVSIDAESFAAESDFRLGGIEHVRYTNAEEVPLSEIVFMLYPNLPSFGGKLQVEQAFVAGQRVEPYLEAGGVTLGVPLPTPLLPGETVDVSLHFETIVPGQAQSGYNIFSFSNDTAALAGFYPAVALYNDKGWNLDLPPAYGDATHLDTSLYQVRLTVPENMVVAASGNLVDSVSNGDGSKTLWLASGPMRDFYLVMRADFQVLSETVAGTIVNSYYPPQLEPGAKRALRYAADALGVFNQKFGQYPFAELDIVATPTTAGGVEYPGIIVISEQLYDLEEGFFQLATVHEVAHQWWYSLVGNDQINEPWLDESLTNYSTIVYYEEVVGDAEAKATIEDYFLRPYQRAQSQGVDRAVIGPVESFSEPDYAIFVYGKGPLFFNALRQEVGDEAFFEILQSYFADHKYDVVTADDLLNTIESVSASNIEPLVEAWLQEP